jgi:hypothetical protein
MKIPAVLVVGAPQNHWADRRSIAVCRGALLRRRPCAWPAHGGPEPHAPYDDPSTGIRIKPRQPLRILDAAQRAPACCARPASRSERGAGWHVGRAAVTIGRPPDRSCYGVGGSCRRSCARHRTDRIAPPCSLRPAAQATNFSRGPQRIRYLRGRNHLPSRVGAPVDFRLHVADRAITEIEVAFQLRHGEMLPFICLPQERAALERTEGGGSPVQRSDGAVSAHVFHDSFPVRTHELGSPCSPAAPRKCDTIIFQFVRACPQLCELFRGTDQNQTRNIVL